MNFAVPGLFRRGRSSGKKVHKSRYVPRVEVLEDRLTPSTTVLQTLPESGGLNYVNGGGLTPPDTQLAVTSNATWEIVNARILARARDANLTQLLSKSLTEFFGAPVWPNGSYFDPRITWDEINQRLFVVALEGSREFGSTPVSSFDRTVLHYAASTTATPALLGDFRLFATNLATEGTTSATRFFGDFPNLGWNRQVYAVSLNMYTPNGVFNHARVLTIEKADVYAAPPPPSVDVFAANDTLGHFSLAPAKMRGSVDSDPMLYVVVNPTLSTRIDVVSQTNPLQNGSELQQYFVTVTGFADPPDGVAQAGANAPQIKTGGPWFRANAVAQFVGSTGNPPQGIWNVSATHTVASATNVAAARWYQFQVTLGVPNAAIQQQGTVVPGQAGASTYFPSLDTTPNGSLVLNFLESGPNEYLSTYIAAREAGNTLGTLEPPILIRSNNVVYSSAEIPLRAGDYSAVSRDPNDNYSAWVANEYASASVGGAWATVVAEIAAVDNRRLVRQLYRDLLRRQPSTADIDAWAPNLDTGTWTFAYVTNGILASTEYKSIVISDYYAQYLLRAANSSDLQSWLMFLNTGGTVEQFRSKVLASTEYSLVTPHVPAATNNDQYVFWVYNDVLFRGDNQTATERAYWVTQLNNNTATREAVALGIIRTSEGFTKLLDRGDPQLPVDSVYVRGTPGGPGFNRPLVPGLYQQVLRRIGDAGGINSFVAALTNGTTTDAGVIVTMTTSLEYLFQVGSLTS